MPRGRNRERVEVPPDPEIERTFRQRRRRIEQERQAAMANRPLREFASPTYDGTQAGIVPPPSNAHNFEIKPTVVTMIKQEQFGGHPSEDPVGHLERYLEILSTFRINHLPVDTVRLTLFTFSLKDRAKAWQRSLPPNSITTWDQLASAFLTKFFPPARSANFRAEITQFKIRSGESIYEAWERYRELLRMCPHHGLQQWLTIEMFYNGLDQHHKNIIDSAAGGSLMSKTYEDAYALICEIADNNYQWHSERNDQVRRSIGTSSQDSTEATSLQAQISGLSNQLKNMSVRMVGTPSCQICGESHSTNECNLVASVETDDVEEVNYMQNQPNRRQYDPFSSTYNPGWRDHPHLSYKNHQTQLDQPRGDVDRPQQQLLRNHRPPGFHQHQGNQNMHPSGEGSSSGNKPDLEAMMMKCLSKIDMVIGEQSSTIKAVVQSTEQNTVAIKNLERQFGQMANANASRNQGTLPSQPDPNPREHCKAVTLRSGKPLVKDPTRDDMGPEEEEPSSVQEPDLVEVEVEVQDVVEKTKKAQEAPKPSKPVVNAYKPPIPFPNRLKEYKDQQQFAKFLEVFKKLQINIPFADALAQIPSHAKFLKDILSNKRKIEEHATVALTEECSAIIQNKLPPKLKDPGSFTIPIQIGDLVFGKALCDLGASINLMPLSIFRKLGLGDIKPTRVTLQLADRSIRRPYGIIEDVLTKVEKFYFPVDFIVLDMEEDVDVPLILGRPFLATGGAIIDVQGGKLTLRVGDEQTVFNVFNCVRGQSNVDSCYNIDVIGQVVQEVFEERSTKDDLENTLINGLFEIEDDEEERQEYVMQLEGVPFRKFSRTKQFEDLGPRKAKPQPSTEVPPQLELKPLPSHLDKLEKEKLIRVLREHQSAIGWTIADLKGLSPSLCMHRIMMEDGFKPSIKHQRRLNPNMKDVVRSEVMKLLDAGIIYSISDSPWTSPVQVVPKKGGVTVVKNEKNELIPTRTVTGWRVCIDYRKLNNATRKDHFPLPFIPWERPTFTKQVTPQSRDTPLPSSYEDSNRQPQRPGTFAATRMARDIGAHLLTSAAQD
ncbi:hypothetical protein OSB04_003906 [Centaurea solstitialis]|uniref:Retrotransposon gag domain-containing protein n=1 Tax=Centaurea solstitialis TaxID=347529 RepID=A0AA38U7I8_9ASTR|nr:hypothetical protein OSB04_003906 [Centaurea solstitialis]